MTEWVTKIRYWKSYKVSAHRTLLFVAGKGGAGKAGGAGAGAAKKEEEKQEIKFDPITPEFLRGEKGFIKVRASVMFKEVLC